MSAMEVSSAAVEAGAAAVASRVADFEARVGGLEKLVSTTIGSDWLGSGAETFRADFAVWLAGAREVHEALSKVASLLGSASQVYEATESAVTHASESSSVSAVDRTGF